MKAKIYNVETCEEALQLASIEFGVDKEELDASKIDEGIEVITIVDGVDKGKQYLQSILDEFGAKGYIEKMTRGNTIEFNVDVKDMNGVFIGKNSKHLLAIQTLLNIIVNKYYSEEEQKTVLLDVGRYRKRREATLEKMAVDFAKQVLKTKQVIKLDNLNAYERKIIHDKLATWTNITTHSEGEEPNRYLYIEYKA